LKVVPIKWHPLHLEKVVFVLPWRARHDTKETNEL